MNTVEIKKNDGSKIEMTIDELSRWMCMMEGFYFIEQRANALGITNYDSLMKPLALEKYIAERYDSMRHDVGIEIELGLL